MDFWGLLFLFLTMIAQVIIPPIPAEVIVVGAARLYGVVPTTICGGLGLFVGSAIVYLFGRYLKNRFSRFFSGDRIARLITHIRRHEKFILWLRILPYNPSDSISYAAGLIAVPPRRFMAITSITSLLRCLMLAALGVWIESFNTFLQAGSILVLSALAVHVILFAGGSNDPPLDIPRSGGSRST